MRCGALQAATLLVVSIARPPVEIRGRRVVVRRYSAGDAAQLHEAILESVEHLAPWMSWAGLEPLESSDRERLIAEWVEQWELGEDFNYAVMRDDVLVGGCGLHKRVGAHGLEIGYWTRASAVGQGVATEAAGCLIHAGFSMSDVHFVEVHHDVANIASGRVPERLGFSLVDERADAIAAPAEIGMERVWRLDRTDWRGLQQEH